jgi:hypothetical protein
MAAGGLGDGDGKVVRVGGLGTAVEKPLLVRGLIANGGSLGGWGTF